MGQAQQYDDEADYDDDEDEYDDEGFANDLLDTEQRTAYLAERLQEPPLDQGDSAGGGEGE